MAAYGYRAQRGRAGIITHISWTPQDSIIFFVLSQEFLAATAVIILQDISCKSFKSNRVGVSLLHWRRRTWASTVHQQQLRWGCAR